MYQTYGLRSGSSPDMKGSMALSTAFPARLLQAFSWIALNCSVIVFVLAGWSTWGHHVAVTTPTMSTLPTGQRNTIGMTSVDPYVLKKFGSEPICDRSRYPPAESLRTDKVTILVNGFGEARIELLQRNMWTYAASPLVDAIYVMWGNLSSPRELVEDNPGWKSPPEDLVASLGVGEDGVAGPMAPVQIFRQPSSSLNDRFLPRTFVRTRAVIICDDDITIDLKLLEFAMRVWRENEHRIVGFFPRAHLYDAQTKSWVYTKFPDRYSVMLTKFMLLHTEYLYEYTCHTPPGVKDFVDTGSNCEDIAMNFVVSQRSLLGPVLLGGNPRDWGDSRNSEKEFASVGLSSRTGHKADRGTCITEFERLWGGMELRYSFTKATQDVEELAMCQKFGYLVNCDARVKTLLQAKREVGLHIVKRELSYAYTTLVGSRDYLPAAVALAQSLRLAGSVHDIVLMVDAAAGNEINVKDKLLLAHFTHVVKVPTIQNRYNVKGFNKINAWRMEQYAKMVYLDVDTLVLANMDHLFEHPEPAAVPDVYMSGKFNSGLLVLKPSLATFNDMMDKMDVLQSYNKGDQGFLNAYFSGWYHMGPEHRLPARYNGVIFFPDHYNPPDWFDKSMVHEVMGPVHFVHFANPWFKPWKLEEAWEITHTYPGANQSAEFVPVNTTAPLNMWSSLWISLVKEMANNSWLPLENDFSLVSLLPNAADYEYLETLRAAHNDTNGTCTWDPSELPASALITKPIGPAGENPLKVPAPLHKPVEPAQPKNMGRTAFVTLITNENYFAAPVWARSYLQYHTYNARRQILLLVLSTVPEEIWQPYRRLFSDVKVVKPISPKKTGGRKLSEAFAILHAWEQTHYQKLVYVDPVALFTDNCNDLLYYNTFAAVPSVFPPDMFSTKVMVIQPDKATYDDMLKKLTVLHYRDDTVDLFLNQYYYNWFRSSSLHRIPTNFGVDMWFKEGLMKFFVPWKILVFDPRGTPWSNTSNWTANDRLEAVHIWRRIFCSLDDKMIPAKMKYLCDNLSTDALP